MIIHLAVDDKAHRSSRHDDAGSFPRLRPTIGSTIVPTVINKTHTRKNKSHTKLLLLKWAILPRQYRVGNPTSANKITRPLDKKNTNFTQNSTVHFMNIGAQS